MVREDRVESDGTVTARFTSPMGHVAEAKVTFPEVRGAAATNKPFFFSTAYRTAARDPRKLVQFAEIAVNHDLKDDARELVADALDSKDCGFDEAFHAMRLMYKCGFPTTGDKAAKIALAKAPNEKLKQQVLHFREKYAQGNR